MPSDKTQMKFVVERLTFNRLDRLFRLSADRHLSETARRALDLGIAAMEADAGLSPLAPSPPPETPA